MTQKALFLSCVMLAASEMLGNAFFAAPSPGAENRYPVRILEVHDGDTFSCDVELGFGLIYARRTCRLAGFDACEVNRGRRGVTVTNEEIEKGKQARDLLRGMVAGAKTIAVVPSGTARDKYGRLLVSLEINGRDVAAQLRKAGFERPK